MAKLEALLEQRGVASPREVSEAVARSQLHGEDLTTSLLQFSNVDEAALSAALSEFYGLPAASVGALPVPEDPATAPVPRELAERYCCFALESAPGELVLAVARPLDPGLKEELGFALGVRLSERVALEVRLRQAIAQCYGLPLTERDQQAIARLDGKLERPGPELGLGSWPDAQLSELPRPPSEPPPPVQERSDWQREWEGATEVAEPRPNPLPAVAPRARRRGPFTLSMARDELARAGSRNQVLDAFFSFACQFFEYSALFAVHNAIAEGLNAAGPGAGSEAIQAVGVPLDLPSSLSEAAESCHVRIMRLGRDGIDRTLATDLRRQLSSRVLVLPVCLRGRCAVLLYGDNGPSDVIEREVGDVIALAPDVAAALGRIILQRKRGAAHKELPEQEASEPLLLARPAQPRAAEAPASDGESDFSIPSLPSKNRDRSRSNGRGRSSYPPPLAAEIAAPAALQPPPPPPVALAAEAPAVEESPAEALEETPSPAATVQVPLFAPVPLYEPPMLPAARREALIARPARPLLHQPRLPSVIVDESATEATPWTRAAAVTQPPQQARNVAARREPARPQGSAVAVDPMDSPTVRPSSKRLPIAPAAPAPRIAISPQVPLPFDDAPTDPVPANPLFHEAVTDPAPANPALMDAAEPAPAARALPVAAALAAIPPPAPPETSELGAPPEPLAASEASPEPASKAQEAPALPAVPRPGNTRPSSPPPAPSHESASATRPSSPPPAPSHDIASATRPSSPPPAPSHESAAGANPNEPPAAGTTVPTAPIKPFAQRHITAPPRRGSVPPLPPFSSDRPSAPPPAPSASARPGSAAPPARNIAIARPDSPSVRPVPRIPTQRPPDLHPRPSSPATTTRTTSMGIGGISASARAPDARASEAATTATPTSAPAVPDTHLAPAAPAASAAPAAPAPLTAAVAPSAATPEVPAPIASAVAEPAAAPSPSVPPAAAALAPSALTQSPSQHPAAEPPPSQRPRRDTLPPLSTPAAEPEIEALIDALCQGNPKAVQELARIGAPTLPQLMARFPGPVVSERAGPSSRASECGPLLQALASIGSPAVPDITRSTGDQDARVRRWATLLLGELPGPEACRAVVQRLADDVPRVHQAALDAARLLLSSSSANLFRKTLFEVAEAEDAPLTLRLRTLEHVARLRDSASVPRLIAFLALDTEPVVHKALWALTVITRQDFGRDAQPWNEWWQSHQAKHRFQWLIEALDHADPRLRKAAADELMIEAKDSFGYSENLPQPERLEAQRRYREWWDATGARRFGRLQ